MTNVNYSSNKEKEEAGLIVTSLSTHMSTKVVFMRHQHHATLNKDRVHRQRERKRQGSRNKSMRQVREQTRQKRQARRSNNGNNEELSQRYRQINSVSHKE